MKRAAVLFAAGVATLLLSGPAIAKDPTTGATAPAEKPSTLAMPHHVIGNVVTVDKSANTVAIKDTKGKDLTLVADSATAGDLRGLKAGDEVKVTYKKSHDQLVATKITMVSPSKTSRTK
jgi:hypothetical protein